MSPDFTVANQDQRILSHPEKQSYYYVLQEPIDHRPPSHRFLKKSDMEILQANQVTNKHLCKVTIIYDNKVLLKNNTNADQI